MSHPVEVSFVALEDLKLGEGGADVLIAFAGEELALSQATRARLGAAADLVARAAKAAKFKGKTSSAMDLLAPADLSVARLIVAGAAANKKAAAGTPAIDYAMMGGHAMGKAGSAAQVAILFDLPEWHGDAAKAAAEF